MKLRSVLSLFFSCLLGCTAGWAQKPKPSPSATVSGSSNVLLDSMKHELDRAMAALGKAEPAPYYMSYSATDRRALAIAASHGALLNTLAQHNRLADISVRVSAPALDNS